MKYSLYSATGCVRCKILMGRMAEMGIDYEEFDFKAEGKEAFQQFYAANRKAIFRGPEGIEFPILTDGRKIVQGIGPALAWLEAGEKLNGFFGVGLLRKEWLDGISVSGGDAGQEDTFLLILRYLKKNAMKLVIETDGRNSTLLEAVLAEGLADRVIMNVLGPLSLYAALAGEEVAAAEVERSIAAVSRLCGYQFQTVVAPVTRGKEEGAAGYLTPAEIGEAARLIEQASGSKKQPYLIKLFRPGQTTDPAFAELEPLTANSLFAYRSAARAYQVAAEIEKE